MSTPRTQSDELLEAWMAATARPIPAFKGGPAHRRPGWTILLAVALVALILVLATLAVGALQQQPKVDVPNIELADRAATAIAAAPAVRYTLTISTHDGDESAATNATGIIDFVGGRFSGTADGGGGGGGAPMFLFGGPTDGAVIVAGGLFVQTERDPWVHVPEANAQLEAFMDPVKLTHAFRSVLDASAVDTDIRFRPCGAGTCRVVTLLARPRALFDAEEVVLGSRDEVPPADFGPTTVELLIDPSSGFPVRMDTTLRAGSTTTQVSLQLERLADAPSISPPIP